MFVINLLLRLIVQLLALLAFTVRIAHCQSPQNKPPDGKALFLRYCTICHGEKGEGRSAVITFAGPRIQAEHNPGVVMTAMEVGPSHMPTFIYTLSLTEMRAVANYVTQQLAVIPLSGGDLAEGGKLFQRQCAPCHGTAARGGGLVFAGTNAPAIAGTSPALVAGAIRWGPGPMPAFPPSVLSDKQVASIVQYVTFVQHPPSPGGNSLKWYGPVAEGFVAWAVVFALVGIVGWIEKGEKG